MNRILEHAMIDDPMRESKDWYLRRLMTAEEIESTLDGIAAAIVESEPDLEKTVLIGIRRRGVLLSEYLQRKLEVLTQKRLPLGILDITFYRDDLFLVDTQPVVEASHLDFEVTGKRVLLVDDVLYTGRTTRAALDSILDYGRPQKIQLIVLIDRGHRELPIQPDFAGRVVETDADEIVEVRMVPIDTEEGVFLTTKELLKNQSVQ